MADSQNFRTIALVPAAEIIDRSDEERELADQDECEAVGRGQPQSSSEPPAPHAVAKENHSGQVRIAYRLANKYRDQLLYVHGLGWHYWDRTRWAFDDIGKSRRAVLHVLKAALAGSLGDKQIRRDVRRCESDNGIRGVLGIASALEEFATTVRDLDADPYLLNMANGTLDLRSMEVSGHDPRDRITKVTRAAYNPGIADVSAVVWPEFLARVLPDEEVREYLQRLMGAALLGKVVEHVLPILTGTGANGKSTFYEAMLWALGDYASTAEPDLFMQRQNAHPTGEMDLIGRRLIVVSESEQAQRLDEAKMKRLTGGDPIKARRMRQDFVEFVPSHLPLLITNHLPKVSGDDVATWRRLRVIPFSVSIPQAEWDTGLAEALQAEADAVLAWTLKGWQQYGERKLHEPPAVMQATSDYKAASDAIGRFIDEECHLAEAVKVTARDLFTAWERFRAGDAAPEISKKAFGQALARRGFTPKESNGQSWWNGICILKSEGQWV